MNAIDYSKLEAEVAMWREGYLESIRHTCGEEYAEISARDLDADPWQALAWFVEDRRPANWSKPLV
jgi:hypothetical protein